MDPRITISESAAQRILFLRKTDPQIMLRIEVVGGGCAGFQYRFSLAIEREEDDSIFEHQGAHVLIDSCSLSVLEGSRVDFVESLSSSAFQIFHPHLRSSCGCGSSFSM